MYPECMKARKRQFRWIAESARTRGWNSDWQIERLDRVCGRIDLWPPGDYVLPLIDQLTPQLAKWIDVYYGYEESAPAVGEISKRLRLNRLTVLAAYKRLVDYGFLKARPGKTHVVVGAAPRDAAKACIRELMHASLMLSHHSAELR